MNASTRALSTLGFVTLVTIALMMAANHVAARLAFDSGADAMTAVVVRSGTTGLATALLLVLQGVSLALTARQWRALLAIGALIGVQSIWLYSAVARLPVALALLAFNTYPLCVALWARVLVGQRLEPRLLLAMAVLLAGLALALDVLGASSGLGVAGQWQRIGAGVAFALGAALIFGLALVLTQHGAGDVDGRVRTCVSMVVAATVALAVVGVRGGFHWPGSATGWWGLALLTLLYGSGITVLLTVLPRLGVVGNTAIMNVEPVFALVLAWLILGQGIAPVQVAGALIVVGSVLWLGLRRG